MGTQAHRVGSPISGELSRPAHLPNRLSATAHGASHGRGVSRPLHRSLDALSTSERKQAGDDQTAIVPANAARGGGRVEFAPLCTVAFGADRHSGVAG